LINEFLRKFNEKEAKIPEPGDGDEDNDDADEGDEANEERKVEM